MFIIPVGSIRLVDQFGQEGRDSGRLEMFGNGVWGTVCARYFDHDDLDVICSSLLGDQYSGFVIIKQYETKTYVQFT